MPRAVPSGRARPSAQDLLLRRSCFLPAFGNNRGTERVEDYRRRGMFGPTKKHPPGQVPAWMHSATTGGSSRRSVRLMFGGAPFPAFVGTNGCESTTRISQDVVRLQGKSTAGKSSLIGGLQAGRVTCRPDVRHKTRSPQRSCWHLPVAASLLPSLGRTFGTLWSQGNNRHPNVSASTKRCRPTESRTARASGR